MLERRLPEPFFQFFFVIANKLNCYSKTVSDAPAGNEAISGCSLTASFAVQTSCAPHCWVPCGRPLPAR